MTSELIRAIIVGICAAVPLGPVAALVVQKTILYGHRTGFITALGSVLMDLLYIVIGVFAVGFLQTFLEEHMQVIKLVGGAIIAIVGVFMAFRDPFAGKVEVVRKSKKLSYFLQSAGFSIANPGAFILLVSLMAVFGVGENKLVALAGIMVGIIGWWLLFTYFVAKSRKFFNMNTLVLANKIIGVIVAVFGVVWVIMVI